MADTPERCPTCSTAVPEGASRCPGCGRVFGEANRCPQCNAVAAVIARGGVTVCAACGKPRAGATVLGGGSAQSMMPASVAGRDASTTAMLSRGRGRAQRGFGVLALAGGVLMAALAAGVLPGAFGMVVAVLSALIGVGLGALSIRAGARNMERAEAESRRAREAAIFELAAKREGLLTAREVADAFHVSEEDADATLTRAIGDGSRVTLDVDDEGVVRYVFLEHRPRAAARVRVDASAPDELEAPASEPPRREQQRREP